MQPQRHTDCPDCGRPIWIKHEQNTIIPVAVEANGGLHECWPGHIPHIAAVGVGLCWCGALVSRYSDGSRKAGFKVHTCTGADSIWHTGLGKGSSAAVPVVPSEQRMAPRPTTKSSAADRPAGHRRPVTTGFADA